MSLARLCVLSFLVISSYALFEDQVGKFDWKLSFIGEVAHSKIELDGKTPRVYVATNNNIVAALNAKTGEILWRHLLESGDEGHIQALHVGSEVVTVSGTGPFMVRGWNRTSGIQAYEWSSPASLPREGLWTADQLKVYQVRLSEGMVELSGFHAKSGNPAGSTKAITSSWISSPSRCCLLDGTLSCLSTEGSGVTSLSLGDLTVRSGSVTALPSLAGVSSVGSALLLSSASDTSTVTAFDSSGSLVSLQVSSKSTATVHKTNSGTVLVQVNKKDDKSSTLEIEFTVLESKKKSKFVVANKFPLARPRHVSAFCTMTASDGEPNCLALISMEDEALTLAQNGKLLWVREEAMANVIGVEIVDLPVSEEEAALEAELANKGEDSSLTRGILGMLSRRLSSQVYQLHNLLSAVLGFIDPSIKGAAGRQLFKDAFGLHKLILLTTKVSKIFAVDNEDGGIIWQTHLRSVGPLKFIDDLVSPIHVLRSARHIPYSTVATILFKDRTTGNSVLYVFDPIDGSVKDGGGLIQLGKKVLQCTKLPESNEELVNGLLLLLEGGEVRVYPASAAPVAARLAKQLYVYTAESTTGALTGYKISHASGSLRGRAVWSVRLPDKLVSIVGKRNEEKVHSQGRVLGDRSVMYKYVNPNLVAAATVSTDPTYKSVVNIYLIDTVSGAIVFSASHRRASEPVHIVHSENWIVYSLFSEKSRRTEVVTLDLYEGKYQRNTTAFSSLDVPVEPLIERQAYIFPHNIVTMKETITEKGITSKHVLLGLSTGGVMEMPWVLLDPRRSVAPTQEMREEGIVPYIPELGLPHEAILTYNHTLEAIRGIHTAPSGLESTCLVFVYGLDLFYTRVMPSKTFDVLKDDFEYWLITAVLTGLVTAAYVTKRLASRKALKLAWK